jgi:hypothetical protein
MDRCAIPVAPRSANRQVSVGRDPRRLLSAGQIARRRGPRVHGSGSEARSESCRKWRGSVRRPNVSGDGLRRNQRLFEPAKRASTQDLRRQPHPLVGLRLGWLSPQYQLFTEAWAPAKGLRKSRRSALARPDFRASNRRRSGTNFLEASYRFGRYRHEGSTRR